MYVYVCVCEFGIRKVITIEIRVTRRRRRTRDKNEIRHSIYLFTPCLLACCCFFAISILQ